jgi:hypothetical protein
LGILFIVFIIFCAVLLVGLSVINNRFLSVKK